MSAKRQAVLGFMTASVLFGLVHLIPIIRHQPVATVFSAHPGASAVHFDEAALYAPGARRFADTGRPAWELDVIELQDERFAYPITHQIVLGTMARLLGSVDRAFAVAHALFPAIIWLGFFGFVFAACGNATLATATAWVASIVAAAPRNALLLGADSLLQPLELSRTPHPALSTAILILGLWGLVRCLTGGGWRWVLTSGAVLGTLFYTYYFHAVVAWAALGSILAFLILSRRKVGRMFAVTAIGLVVAGPYVMWTLASLQSANSAHLMARIGGFGRTPNWIGVAGLLVCAVLFVVLGNLRNRRSGDSRQSAALTILWVCSAALAAAFIVRNLHVLTGYDAQHEHVYNRIVQPFLVILAGAALPLSGKTVQRWLEARPARLLLTAVTIGIIAISAWRQVHVASAMASFQHESAIEIDQFAALDRLDHPMVVGALDTEIRALLPALTKHWSFVPIGMRTLASNEEIVARFVVVAKLSGMEKRDALAMLSAGPLPGQMRTYAYGLLDSYELTESDARLLSTAWETSLQDGMRNRRLDVLLLPPGRVPAAVTGITWTPVSAANGWTAFSATRVTPR